VWNAEFVRRRGLYHELGNGQMLWSVLHHRSEERQTRKPLRFSYIAVMVMIAYTAVIISMCPFGLYHRSNDVIQFIIQSIIFTNYPFGCFKAFTVVRHSDNIRRFLDVTRLSSAITDPDSARFFQMSRNILLNLQVFWP
jgi:hypothetical protein